MITAADPVIGTKMDSDTLQTVIPAQSLPRTPIRGGNPSLARNRPPSTPTESRKATSMTRRNAHSQIAVSNPPLAGKVLTVRGPIDPSGLGMTLMHEHLFLDLRKNHLPYSKRVRLPGRSEPIITSEDFPATELARWEAKLDLANLHDARNVAPLSDNYVLADEAVAIHEVMEFKDRGGGAIVEVTSIGLKRDPAALLRVSEATGLHLVMGTGYYQKVFHPHDMDELPVEALTNVIVQDVTVGVGDTGIRAGIIPIRHYWGIKCAGVS